VGRAEQYLNVEDFRRRAKAKLPLPLYDYIEGGADDEYAVQNNVTAFERLQFRPRYLKDVRDISLQRSLFGRALAYPLILAPTGMSRLFHPAGEQAVARAVADANVGYALSTMSTVSIEDISPIHNGLKIFQLYLFKDDGLNRAMIERARAQGFDALCITVDCILAGNRERDVRHGLTVPPKLTPSSLLHFISRPQWCWNYFAHEKISLPNIANIAGARDLNTLQSFFMEHMEQNISWEKIGKIADLWKGPLAIKGIQSAEDAQLAHRYGVTAVIISNHGGRQLDCVPAPIEILPEIVEAVGGQCEIILDGGIRRGSDVVKALALGASGCMMGRPYLYALAAHGEAGVRRLLHLMETEIRRTCALLGCASLDALNPEVLRKAVV